MPEQPDLSTGHRNCPFFAPNSAAICCGWWICPLWRSEDSSTFNLADCCGIVYCPRSINPLVHWSCAVPRTTANAQSHTFHCLKSWSVNNERPLPPAPLVTEHSSRHCLSLPAGGGDHQCAVHRCRSWTLRESFFIFYFIFYFFYFLIHIIRHKLQRVDMRPVITASH